MVQNDVVTQQPSNISTISQGYNQNPTSQPKQLVVIITNFGPDPMYITCPSCHQKTVTRVEYESTTHTHLMAALICGLGGTCCCCLPYCMNDFRNANHYCALCGDYAGTYVPK